MACIVCHGFPGVNCNLCGDFYCPFCWLDNQYDVFTCVSLCDACYHNLKEQKKGSMEIFLVKTSGDPYPHVIKGGRNLLKFFKDSADKSVEKIQVPNSKLGLHLSV